jgi:DnaJ domain
VTVDHYATLGVSRTSEDVVIRAAYRALMRLYHPDANPSPGAAQRVRDINSAYEVLRDKAKREAYDHPYIERPAGVLSERKRPPVGPIFFAATMLLLSLAVLAVWMKPLSSAIVPLRTTSGSAPLPPPPIRAEPTAAIPFAPVAAPAPAAAPSLRRPPAPPAAMERSFASVSPRPAPAPIAAKVTPSAPAAAVTSAAPLRLNASLNALDLQLIALDSQSWSRAGPAKRDALLRTKRQFAFSRLQCGSEACLRALSLGRMKLVATIMSQGQSLPAR